MPNHVHLILTPSDPMGLALAIGRTHRVNAGNFNVRARQTGHLFQGRFGSVAMDEDHLMNAARYLAINPVRARLVAKVLDRPHSSVHAHLAGRGDGLVEVDPLPQRAPNFADFIELDVDDPAFTAPRRSELIGSPPGSPEFVADVEHKLGRTVTPGKRRWKPAKIMGVAKR